MEINLSMETINAVYVSLKSSQNALKHELVFPIRKMSPHRQEIILHRLEEVEGVLAIFEELRQNK